MAAYIRTLSQLPEISAAQLAPNAYFEVSNPVSAVTDIDGQSIRVNYIYASKKIKKSEVAKDIIQDVRADLRTTEHISGQNFGWLYDDYVKLITQDYTLSGRKTFEANPKHKNQINNFDAANQQDYSVNLSALKKYSNLNCAPTISPTYGFVTHLSGNNNTSAYYNIFKIDANGRNVTVENKPSFVFSPSSAKELAQNEFIFKIETGKKESKVWEAPASGIFTCYGWLDEIHNEKVSNENRWVALMGKQEQLGVWTTLQVQPFIQNNYLSYVGFTFPVHKGMKLKVVTGFAVGSNSDKYFKNGSSLANNIANAFLGGIYTGLSVDNNAGGNYTYTNVDPSTPIDRFDPTELCSMLCTQIKHEHSCDIETSAKVDYLSDEIDLRSKYIDTVNQQGSYRTATLMLYRSTIDMELGAQQNSTWKQKYWQSDGNGSTWRNIYLINTEDLNNSFASRNFSPGTVRNYYAPPEHSEDYGSIKNGTVERAYTRGEIPFGAVFTDGARLFYKVSQDCTVVIKVRGDFSEYGTTAAACGMLYGFARRWQDTKCVTFSPEHEIFGNIGDPGQTISLPVKKGTIFMFDAWIRDYYFTDELTNAINKTSDGTNRDGFAKYLFKTFNMPAVVPNYNGLNTTLESIYGYNHYTSNVGIDGTTYTYDTHLLRPDGMDRNTWIDKLDHPELFKESTYEGNTYQRGTLAYIVEIPM